MRRDTWFKCDPLDLLEGIETCEDEAQSLVYVAVLMRIYASGGPVPNNAAAIAAVTHMSTRKVSGAIDGLVANGKLTETDDGRLFNRRAGHELGGRIRLSETRAAAGKLGGRPKKTSEKSRENASRPSREHVERDANAKDNSGETAENGQSEKPKAFHARAREEEIREESPPTPQKLEPDRDGQKPGKPLTADDRAKLAKEIAGTAKREVPDDQVARLTGEIMRRAKMTAPPIDLVLVEGWVAQGIDEQLILEVVTRLGANAKTPIRAFRYFAAEIKRQHEARSSADDAAVAEFRRIAARARSP